MKNMLLNAAESLNKVPFFPFSMSRATSKAPKPYNASLGKLLVDAGVVGAEQIEICLESSLRTGVKIGESLVAFGHLSMPQLSRALIVQRQLKDGTVCLDWAMRTIRENRPALVGEPLQRFSKVLKS